MDVLVLMSGGIDSTACAHYFLERGNNVRGVFVDYGQVAREPEIEAVRAITQHLNIPLRLQSFDAARKFGPGEILGRNAFLIFAALMGEHPIQGILSLGVHQGTGYYDCGKDFVESANSIVQSYSAGSVALLCPFLSKSKSFIYGYSKNEGLPLSLTYSCELGTVPPCGHCSSCRDRHALSTV